ncbi:uncharacterized protein [Diadema setosum]|uniref:uncharacterized protein n=1 Tax=Diadema setosum TaxID=31175 RepID=UPI003B3BE96D
MNCAFGLATDSNGCEICMCKMSVASGFLLSFDRKASHCPALSAATCTLVCDEGYHTNHLGCQICQCVNQSGSVDDCPPMDGCRLLSKCPYGLANDRNHCPRCACRHPGICEPLPEYCDLECPWGFATDKFGCEMCQCKKTQGCSILDSCPLTCPLGLATCPCLCDICRCKLPNSDTLSALAELTRIPILNDSNLVLAEGSGQHRCPDQLCLNQCHQGYDLDPLTGCPTCQCTNRMRCPSLREPKIISEKRCESAEDCEPPYMCCYTGSRFMCVKALEETCLDKSGSQHSHGEVWYENCRTQGSCFHGNTKHVVFVPPRIPDGCEMREIEGHCFPSYTCDDDSCRSKSSWSVDECTTCSCVVGKPVCTTLPCPETPEGCRTLAIEGACCPDIVCPGCSDAGGHPTVEGQMWNNDLCTSCVCHQGETACRRVVCESPGPDCLQVFLPNQCCPMIVCPAANKRPCEIVRSALAPLLLMDERQTWLPSYYTPTCDSHGFFNATQCYPAEGVCWCADHLGREQDGSRMKNGVPSCTYSGCIDREGNYRGENEHWHEDPCTNCNCTLGLPLCLGLKCATPPPGCDPLESEADCSCPQYICRDFCFGEQAGFRRLGAVWEGEDCTQCKCSSEGTISCGPMACSVPRPIPPGCQRLKRSSSECCPSVTVCLDPLSACPDTMPVAQCGSNPCLTTFCPVHPDAICHVNFCGRCQAIFYQRGVPVVDCSPRLDQAFRDLLVTDVAATRGHIICNPNQKLPTASWSEYFPRCTAYGTFSPKQCDATGTCWCVDEDGLPENNPKTSSSSRVTCVEAPCRKELNENAQKANRGDPVTTNPVCNSDGTYAEEQCNIDGSRCWCSERDGTMVQGTERPSGQNLTCQPACEGMQPLAVISCNSVSPCPLNYFCRFQSLSNLGICCPQG